MLTKDNLNLSLLKYVVLPGHMTHQSSLRFYYNQAYLFYKKVWERILNRLDGQGTYSADSFYRASQVATIFYDTTVVGQICCRELHLDNVITQDIPYFGPFNGKALEDLRLNDVKKLLTLEANALNPQFSKRKTQIPFTEISMQLSVMLAKSLDMECCTGTPRTLTGVQNTATQMGFTTIESGIISHHCPVDIVLCYVNNLRKHTDSNIADLIEQLWNTRIDYRQIENIEKVTTRNINQSIHGEKIA